MRILIYELKKIWNIKIIGIIVVLCVIYFGLSLMDEIRWYPRGTWFGSVDFAHHLTENYGTSLSLEDFEDFLLYRDIIAIELDSFFIENAFYAEVGILSFDDLQAFREYYGSRYEELSTEERNRFRNVSLELGYIVRTEEYGDLTSENETPVAYIKINSYYNVVSFYEINIIGCEERLAHISSFMEWQPPSQREYQRLTEIRDSGELTSIMPQMTLFHTWRYARGLSVLVVLVTLVLVSSLVVSDRSSRVNWLQYSSKEGRKVFGKQFLAVLISALGATTVLVAVFIGVFAARTGVYAFWGNGINSFLGATFHWLSITFLQYVLLMAGVMYLLATASAALAFVCSRFSINMIRLMFKIIPLFVVAVMVSNWVLDDFLVVFVGGNVLLQAGVVLGLVVLAAAVGVFIVRRERLVEVG